MNNLEDRGRLYLERCKQPFWQNVFHLEIEYLIEHLKGCRDILSVGCGPATIEGELAKYGFHVTGLDISREALSCAPDRIRTVVGRAEDMAFPRHSFDAVIYVASLQFVDDYRTALDKSAAVVRPGGRLIVMLLNPASAFFQKNKRTPLRISRASNIRTWRPYSLRPLNIFWCTENTICASMATK